MTRTIFCLLAALLIAGCAAPGQSLPGRLVEAEIATDPQKLRIVDWAGAGRVANSEGILYQQIPQSSPKPTEEEIAEANAILERNRAYTQYVQRPEVLREAERRAVPALERELAALPNEGFATNRYRYPPFNSSGTALKLVLHPDGAIVSPKTFAERTSGQAAADLAVRGLTALLVGAASASRETIRYIGDYQLVSVKTGNPLRSGRLNARFRYDRGLSGSISNEKLFAMMIWDAILRGATTGPARTRPQAKTSKVAPTSPEKTTVETTRHNSTVSGNPTQSYPVVAGSPPLFEGTSYALFTPEHIQAYCMQNWRTRPSSDGRTEYNPCTERSAFSP